jgi:hypothetical protein
VANRIGAQDLTVNSNGSGGFSVFMRASGSLSNGSHPFTDAPGNYAATQSFPSPGTEAFGFTTSENGLPSGTPDRFTSPSATWAAVPATDSVVSYRSTAPSGADTVCVAFQTGASGATPVGTYTSTVIYTAVPAF